MKSKFKFLKILVFITISIYVIITLINQQKVLSSYNNMQDQLNIELAEKEKYQEELKASIQNINSEEYIEKVAREKLGMYKTNERVYVNMSN